MMKTTEEFKMLLVHMRTSGASEAVQLMPQNVPLLHGASADRYGTVCSTASAQRLATAAHLVN